MNSFAVIVVLFSSLLALGLTDETQNEVNAEVMPKNPAPGGHRFQFNANTEGRKAGLEKLRELMKKNLGLKPKQQQGETEENREKRGALLGHHQPIHHVQQQGAYCPPDYVVEYVEYYYEPQYCY